MQNPKIDPSWKRIPEDSALVEDLIRPCPLNSMKKMEELLTNVKLRR